MPESSIKLGPLPKRLFLEFELKKKVEDKAEYNLIDEDGPTSFDFLRFLFISRGFVNVSRRCPIFCLYVQGDSKNYNSWNFLFKDESFFYKNDLGYAFEDFYRYKKSRNVSLFFNLSFKSTHSLMSLLNPSRLCVYLNDNYYSQEQYDECVTFFENVNGNENGLILSGAIDSSCIKLLNRLSPVLRKLSCPIKFLSNPDLTSLKLDYFRTQDSIGGVGELNEIFKHEIKNVKVKINHYFEYTEYDQFGNLQQLDSKFLDSLECLKISFQGFGGNGTLNSTMDFLKKSIENFPNLKTFCFDIRGIGDSGVEKSHIHTQEEINDHVSKTFIKLLELRDICKSANIKMSIKTHLTIYRGPEIKPFVDCGWSNLVLGDGRFKIKSHEHIERRTHKDVTCLVDFMLEDSNLKSIYGVSIDYRLI